MQIFWMFYAILAIIVAGVIAAQLAHIVAVFCSITLMFHSDMEKLNKSIQDMNQNISLLAHNTQRSEEAVRNLDVNVCGILSKRN